MSNIEERGFRFEPTQLLAPRAAVATFLARVKLAPPGTELVALDDALARILAQAAQADVDYPNAPRSSMDGFAFAAADAAGEVRLVGEVPMGGIFGRPLMRGQAVRIPTGGLLPSGADTVVPLEGVRLERDILHFDGTPAVGEHVTPRGDDMRAGERILEPGRRLGAPELGVLATLGIVAVPVFRRPVIGILSNGDELVEPASTPDAGEIRDSNRFAIAATLRAMGARPLHLPSVGDAPGALEAALRDALADCDGLILSGGSSVGQRDRVPEAIAALGEPGVIVHGLRIKPGMPSVLAALGKKPILGLPGNPASALLVLEAVLAPVIAAMVGAPLHRCSERAVLAEPMRSREGWTWFVPVLLKDEPTGLAAHPLVLRSSRVSLAARASGYVEMDETCDALAAGTPVRVVRFSCGGFFG